MTGQRPITIIGGGLAGLALGIGLRRREIPAAICEAGRYPRHRVCGEFISGRGQRILEEFGLLERLGAGAIRMARTVAFFSERITSGVRTLPRPALCCSRFQLDALLALEFCDLGGELKQNERWRDSMAGEGLVRATGRRVGRVGREWRWLGLKVHARQVELTADLEMHFLENAYIGLCRLPDEQVNICGLFRTRTAVLDLAARWAEYLRGTPSSTLSHRLVQAVFEEASFCSVAGLSFGFRRAQASSECSLGDALGMIAPVTGNGMSIAFESAALAMDPLGRYSEGKITWPEAQHTISRRCDTAFSRRFRVASWLQSVLFQPTLRSFLIPILSSRGGLFRLLFALTR